MRHLKNSLPALALLAVLSHASLPAAAQSATATLERNLQSTNTLIEKSSAARRVQESGNARAAAERDRARDLYQKAKEAAGRGQAKEAAALINDAKKAMLEAVRLAGAGQVAIDKERRDYEAKATSVVALLSAQDRVADQTSASASRRRVHQDVEALLDKARIQATAGDYRAGLAFLDAALDKLRVSIEQMRGGQTLENRLDFKTKKDEFEYYWVKTESQLEAIGLATQNVAGTPKETSIRAFAKKMEQTRAEARRQADRGDHAGAVKTLEPMFMQAPFQLMSALQ
jgi:hypothetical protein